jgi:hypothetical protein
MPSDRRPEAPNQLWEIRRHRYKFKSCHIVPANLRQGKVVKLVSNDGLTCALQHNAPSGRRRLLWFVIRPWFGEGIMVCSPMLWYLTKVGSRPGLRPWLSVRENLNMLHRSSTGRREMGDNSFLRDFKARMLSSRRAMLRSIILRVSSSESPAEHKVLVLSR